jgi:hypothetical protein
MRGLRVGMGDWGAHHWTSEGKEWVSGRVLAGRDLRGPPRPARLGVPGPRVCGVSWGGAWPELGDGHKARVVVGRAAGRHLDPAAANAPAAADLRAGGGGVGGRTSRIKKEARNLEQSRAISSNLEQS